MEIYEITLLWPPNIDTQRLGEHLPGARDTHATVEELLNTGICAQSVSWQVVCSERKLGD